MEEVTELRDILPTFLDAAGLPIPESLNGSSLLNLLRVPRWGNSRSVIADSPLVKWREYIDLEHNIVYNVTNHWNALTDGRTKYIFQAYFANEQLFNLQEDPEELNNLAQDPEWQEVLEMWRERMVLQFQHEGRGPEWVEGGRLMQRVNGMNYSPHYPGEERLRQMYHQN